MWASRVDDEFGWEAWCRENEFNLENLQLSFRFKLPGASILTLDDPDQIWNACRFFLDSVSKIFEMSVVYWTQCRKFLDRLLFSMLYPHSPDGDIGSVMEPVSLPNR